jgi:hypothetical protein
MLTVPREKPKGKNEGCYCGFCLCIKENCCLNTIFRMERLIRSRGLRYYCCRLHQGEGRLQKRSFVIQFRVTLRNTWNNTGCIGSETLPHWRTKRTLRPERKSTDSLTSLSPRALRSYTSVR